jgi:hypothetical protein
MLQPRDIVVLLAVARAPEGWTIRSMGAPIGVGTGAAHRALERLADVGLYDPGRRQVNLATTNEFVRHAARYLFHRDLGKPARGVPTAWGAAPLAEHLASLGGEPPPVWPSSKGSSRGPKLEPLVANAVAMIETAPTIAEDLSLLDAIAVGDVRSRTLAADMLMERLSNAVSE